MTITGEPVWAPGYQIIPLSTCLIPQNYWGWGGFPKDKEIDFKVEAEDLKVYNTEIKLEDKKSFVDTDEDLDEEFYYTMSELETDEDLNEEFYDVEESQIGGSKLKKKSFYNQRKKSIRKKTVKKNSAISKDTD